MRKNTKNISLIVSLVLCLTWVMMPSISSEAAVYDANAAVSYGKAHWDDGVGVCDQFVKACLKAGGITIKSGGVGAVLNEIKKYGSVYELKKSGKTINIKDNTGKVSPGDPIFFYCSTCKSYKHVVLCSSIDKQGVVRAYGHNAAWNDSTYVGDYRDSLKHSGSAITVYSVHMNPSYNLRCYLNYSGKNYFYQSDFSEGMASSYWASRDTSVATVSVDTEETHNGYNSLKIVNHSPGTNGKDLLFGTMTQGNHTNDSYVGDNRAMTLSFWAKASTPGTKMYFRWGYDSNLKSVLLSDEWTQYILRMDKTTLCGNNLHPYVDTAGTVWLSQLQLEDGTEATEFVPETGTEYSVTKNEYNGNYTLPADPTRPGYHFVGWFTENAGNTDDKRISSSTTVKAGHLKAYAHWEPVNVTTEYYYNNSGKNYLYQSDFSAGIDSDYWLSRDTAVSTLSSDSVQTHDGYSSLKIVNQSAGALGKDLAIRTLTQQDSTNGNFIGDHRSMVLSFWAKATTPGTKMFFRWGYEPVTAYRSVTLTQEWQYYTLPMDKIPTFGQYIHPYIDKAGTVWLSEIQLEDGTEATAFVPEQKGLYMELEQVYGDMQMLPPEPEREGYQFDGWYTQAAGGSQLTELQQVQPGNIAVYAHWSKVEEPVLEISSIQTSETGMDIQMTGNPDQDVQLIVAAYTTQGAMLGTSMQVVAAADIAEEKIIPVELNLSEAASVTAFVLTDDGSMTPLAEEKKLEL